MRDIFERIDYYREFFGNNYRYLYQEGKSNVFIFEEEGLFDSRKYAFKIIDKNPFEASSSIRRFEDLSEQDKENIIRNCLRREGIYRNLKEIDIGNKLKSPYIVPYINTYIIFYYDESIQGIDIVIKMPYLDCVWDKYPKQGKNMSEEEIIKFGIDICKALEKAHSNKIINRDVKLMNMYHKDDTYLLGDWGIARELNDANYMN